MDLHPLETEATQAALEANWDQAIDLNKQIVKDDPANLGAYNRLGRAYSEVGQLDKAKSSYREVLTHDPYNAIALKNLERLKAINVGGIKITPSRAIRPDLFLETPGKTKVLLLGDLAKPETLAVLHTGDQLKITDKDSSVRFEDHRGTKLGVFEGEDAARLAEMLRAGNLYEAYVKSAQPTALKVFVREIQRVPKFSGSPSFPIDMGDFKPYVHEGAVVQDPIIHAGQEVEVSIEEPEPSEHEPTSKKSEVTATLAESEAEETEQD